MPKKKKFPRLPSGFGSIRYIGGNRANPYAVHPPCTDRDENGRYIRPAAICYVPDWYTGFSVLSAWKSGTYYPGLEKEIALEASRSEADMDDFCRRIIRNMTISGIMSSSGYTFREVYDDFIEFKYGEHAPKKLSKSSRQATQAAYKQLSELHDLNMNDITLKRMQSILNDCDMSKSTVEGMLFLLRSLFDFSVPRKYVSTDLAQYLVMPSTKDVKHGKPFSEEDLSKLWIHKDDPVIEMVLIMCYSGYRISAYTSMDVNTDQMYFFGGVKTKNGKERYVPIHSSIQPLVTKRLARYGALISSTQDFRKEMHEALSRHNITDHNPHDCRHTFATLCEKYKVNADDQKRMMGHTFGNDITKGLYTHRTVEDLRQEIEKIVVTNT